MRYYILPVILLLFFLPGCQEVDKTSFTTEALQQKVYNIEMQESDIQTVLDKYKGKKVMIELWASWCADCIKALPSVQEFQKNNPDIPFVFLSVDEKEQAWKTGIAKHMDKFNIQGEQLFFNTGWKKDGDNAFIEFAGLDWIPRYMLVGEDGKILVYYAKKITDKSIKENL